VTEQLILVLSILQIASFFDDTVVSTLYPAVIVTLVKSMLLKHLFIIYDYYINFHDQERLIFIFYFFNFWNSIYRYFCNKNRYSL